MNILIKSLTITLSLIAGLQAIEIENTDLGNCAPEIALKPLAEVVKDNYVKYNFTQFIESVRPLRMVCISWKRIIDKKFMHKAMLLGCQQICPEFLNGKLIYQVNSGIYLHSIYDEKHDEGKIELKISDLWNPLGGTFKLSGCGNSDHKFKISTGYKKSKAEDFNKIEIWFTPRFLVEKDLNTTAGHFRQIFPSKWNNSASVGMFWTFGSEEGLEKYSYLTSDTTDTLSSISLFDNWAKSEWSADIYWPAPSRDAGQDRCLTRFKLCL